MSKRSTVGGPTAVSSPRMTRSRNQLASAYAPGAFFTFEGGQGACISVVHPDATLDPAPIGPQTQSQILSRLHEIWSSWFRMASALGDAQRRIFPEQCVDHALLRGGQFNPLPGTSLDFVSPLRMGYSPAPLTFVCNRCSLFRAFESVKDFQKRGSALMSGPCAKGEGKRCHWRQLDVIFVHWSGTWEPASPAMFEWRDDAEEVRKFGEQCRSCGSSDFLLKTESPRIGQWYFQCARCGNRERDSWLQNDPDTTELFRETAGRRIAERRMEPISYRASSVYYAQSETFVVFGDGERDLLALLSAGQTADLEAFIARRYGFGAAPPSEAEMLESLRQAGQVSEVTSYETFKSIAELPGSSDAIRKSMDEERRKLVARWVNEGTIVLKTELPGTIAALIRSRSQFSSRYDPFLLSVEHECLRRTKLERTMGADDARPYVRFVALDARLAPKDELLKQAQEARTEELMSRLGMEELGLIREFDLCRFTHGYTRVHSSPVAQKHNMDVPVRLNLFSPLKANNKRPIFVVTQGNEALYVRLREDDVHAWLSELGFGDDVNWSPDSGPRLGGLVLESARPFGRYLADLKPDRSDAYRYLYTLLHSYAHTIMKAVAENSGLDLGSLGEYLFPADLAFVVYRSGTTMDLGNLSSLWRNQHNRFLEHVLANKTHSCNSGSLCDAHGGACPDCIMVPETSCIASNRLLSRSVLKGGGAPREDLSRKNERIPGFLTVSNARHQRG